ncbi:hypothetical protein BDY19DRAFT_956016 [Irpex rosettiformis]|uniref:Uncharacterized protein n=1 Tax=Irpex rosettiformis TaxID=378272 RepID=A0ACB8TYY2_9APHY|nr:hypothetical protein BDY19DRAFT_956016 [Irpex rosettiformis]
MIIPEDTPQTPKAPPQSRELEEDAEIPATSPPAYPGHESGSYQAGTSSTQPLYVPVEPLSRTEPAGRRFLKAFGLAILIWFLFAALTSSVAELGRQSGRALREHKDAATAWPLPSDGRMLMCFKGPLAWDTIDGAHHVTLDISRTSDVLYLFSRGMETVGNVAIVQDERSAVSADGEESQVVSVDIVARGATPMWSHVFAVCALERRNGEKGIGIFTPKKWHSGGHYPSFDFDVTIRLPRSPSGHPLHVKSIETNLPNFEHHVGDLLGSVNFDSLSLRSSNAHIFSRSLNVTHGNFETTNKHIRGHYESHGNLTLRTSNADIVADVSLFNHDPNVENVLNLQTSNAKIESTINLFSSLNHGSYTVSSKTSNGRLSLSVPVLPPDSTLHLSANTTNLAAAVAVPDTYEGTYVVKTSNSRAVVKSDRRRDPTGKERKSIQWESGTGPYREGGIEWKENHVSAVPSTEEARGSIWVSTQNAPATLYL